MITPDIKTTTSLADRARQLGQARIDVIGQVKSPEDWQRLWQDSEHSYPFAWGDCWTHCIQYAVEDFAAEAGFFLDIVGFEVNAFDADYAMFCDPERKAFFSFVPASDEQPATPPGSIRLEFMVDDILGNAAELESRGVVFEAAPEPCAPGASLYKGHFRSPNGFAVELWGQVDTKERGAE